MFSNDLLKWIRTRKERDAVIDSADRDVVVQNLLFLYHACVASEQLLSLAANESLKPGQFNQRLRKYYQIHLEEEKGEVGILRRDLRESQVKIPPPDTIVMAMVGSQYYMLYHVHPVCLLGYLTVAETDPMPIKDVEKLEELHGANLCRFLRMHALKDLEHAEELKELLDAVPFELHWFIHLSIGNVLDYFALAAKNWKTRNLVYG